MKKGAVLPLHKHPQHETYLIVQGNARVTVGDQVTNVNSPHVVDIPGNVPHQIEARSGDLVFFYAFEEGPVSSVIYKFESKLPRINGVVPEDISAAPARLDLNNNLVSDQSPHLHKFVHHLLMDKEMMLSLGNIG